MLNTKSEVILCDLSKIYSRIIFFPDVTEIHIV